VVQSRCGCPCNLWSESALLAAAPRSSPGVTVHWLGRAVGGQTQAGLQILRATRPSGVMQGGRRAARREGVARTPAAAAAAAAHTAHAPARSRGHGVERQQ